MILIIDCGSSKTPMIDNYVKEFYPDTKILSKENFREEELESAKAVVISGAPILLSQQDAAPFLEIFRFLKTTELPVLGICFGHQVLGMLYGAEVFMGKPVREKAGIELINNDPLFKDIPLQPDFAQDHTEGISLPHGFIHLARSEDYETEAMKHPEKPLYGVQFHPEVSGDNGRMIFRNFLNIANHG